MTATTDHAPSDVASTSRPAAAEIVCFGTLAWLGWVWLAATVVYAVVLACVIRWGSVDESLFQSVAASWQRYLVFAAGVTVTTTFLRMLVRNGATRRMLSTAAVTTMGVVAILLAVWNVAGFSIEHVLFDRYDWPHRLRDDRLFTWGDLPRLAIESALVIAAYHLAGWIVGVCYVRWGALGGTLRLLPALLPAAAMELVVTPEIGGMDVDVLASWRDGPHLLLTIGGGVAILVASIVAARRLTSGTTLR